MTPAGNTFFFPWEVSLMQSLQAHLSGTMTKILSYLSIFGEETLLLIVLGILYYGISKKLGKSIGRTALLSLAWGSQIKNIAMRRRPYFDHEGIDVLRVVEPDADVHDIAAQGFSFPSMHSSNAVTVYGGLAMKLKKSWAAVLSLLIILGVGVSRVAMGVHYPTDVMGGWVLGIACCLLTALLEKKIEKDWGIDLLLLCTMLPGLFFCKSNDYYTSLGLAVGFFAGTLAEEKWVHFENTRSIPRIILRVLGMLALYLALNTLLKLPFSGEFLESPVMAAWLVRTLRYALIGFACFGIYPRLFSLTVKIGGKNG